MKLAVSQVSGLLLRSSTGTGFVVLPRHGHLNHPLVPGSVNFQPKTLQEQSTAGVALLCGVAHG